MKLNTVSESILAKNKVRKVQTILGEMSTDDSKFTLRKPIYENLSVDLKPAAFNVALKQALKKAGVDIKSVRIVNSYNWPKCYVQVYGTIPNEVRLAVLNAMYPGGKSKGPNGEEKEIAVKDMNDIQYGTIDSNRVAAHAADWVTAVENL